MLGNAGCTSIFFDDAFNRARGETAIVAGGIDRLKMAAIVEEEGSKRIGAGVEVVLDPVGGGFGDENWAVFAAFTTDNEFAAIEIDGITVELDEFGDAKAARKKEFNNGAIAETGFGVSVDTV